MLILIILFFCKKAKLIQRWLTDVAKEVTSSVSPEHVQKICNGRGIREIEGSLESHLSRRTFPRTYLTWSAPLIGHHMKIQQPYQNTSKQVRSFPANFIHSLDSSHMFATALACSEVMERLYF